ncbi:DUF2076 domain-containing protein [Bradyrhizobium sp. HKCCYLRH3099]|uniref:DUF2076 domain-containing protein n=1 Tax=unclassified Bradyrhizobium TaxID=2631580 RepID=UPI003EBE08F5
MTPQERQLIDDLFDRLAKLESAPRDPEAAAAISQALQRAPNAVYALVQTVLVQDEALKRANARIEELQHAQAQAQSGGFLDSMRDSIFGSGGSRGSVPNVPPPLPNRPVWNSGQAMPPAGYQGQPGYPGQPGPYDQGGYGQQRGGLFGGGGGGGGSFLGTAAAAAAGMVGGSLLLGGIRSMMGGGQHQAFGDTTIIEERGGGGSPWGGSDQSSGSLANDAGLNDIGRSGGDGGRAGLFDQASYDDSGNDNDAADFDADDGYGDDDGGSNYA